MLSIRLVGVALGLILVAVSVAASPSPDTSVLQAFQASADPSLRSLNWSGGDACNATKWIGVSCDNEGRVRELVLEGLNLTGPIAILSNLTQLRILSLKDNAFNGSMPDMQHWRYLRHLYLHNNQLSGALPKSLAAATRLLRFTANNNLLTGPMPQEFSTLTHLATLRLENNQLSGPIPPIQLLNLSDFNISHNQLVGSIPMSLERFGASAFAGNPLLCGRPLFPGIVCDGTTPKTVPSTESAGPGVSSEKKKPALSTGAIVAIVFGDAMLFLLIAILSVTYYWRRYPRTEKLPKKIDETLVMTRHTPTSKVSESSKLMFFEHSIHFELGDLLRASAEMLGKGSFGTTYKAVLETGVVVAVKRMKDLNGSSKKDFQQKIEMIGKLWHPNMLPLRAYYFAKEEKLLVYDYEPNGSLHLCLHGHGPCRTALNWATRLKIILEVARALRHLHHECGKPKLVHGNIKSANILLDENYNALLADFGLAMITYPGTATTTARVAGYRAPEQADSKHISQAADVYSFGVVSQQSNGSAV